MDGVTVHLVAAGKQNTMGGDGSGDGRRECAVRPGGHCRGSVVHAPTRGSSWVPGGSKVTGSRADRPRDPGFPAAEERWSVCNARFVLASRRSTPGTALRDAGQGGGGHCAEGW